jgi:hypothetical protein
MIRVSAAIPVLSENHVFRRRPDEGPAHVSPRDRKPVCSLFGRYEMCHFRSALDLKMRDVFLQYAICVGPPLMLPQMFEPGFHREKIASFNERRKPEFKGL